MVEYGLLIAGVALVSAAAVSVFGHKTSDLIGSITTVLPGVHAEDNGSMTSGHIIETTDAADGPITIDTEAINANTNTERLGDNFGASLTDLVVESQ